MSDHFLRDLSGICSNSQRIQLNGTVKSLRALRCWRSTGRSIARSILIGCGILLGATLGNGFIIGPCFPLPLFDNRSLLSKLSFRDRRFNQKGGRLRISDGCESAATKTTIAGCLLIETVGRRKGIVCPCRIDFSRALAVLMATNGNATSISFFLVFKVLP